MIGCRQTVRSDQLGDGSGFLRWSLSFDDRRQDLQAIRTPCTRILAANSPMERQSMLEHSSRVPVEVDPVKDLAYGIPR